METLCLSTSFAMLILLRIKNVLESLLVSKSSPVMEWRRTGWGLHSLTLLEISAALKCRASPPSLGRRSNIKPAYSRIRDLAVVWFLINENNNNNSRFISSIQEKLSRKGPGTRFKGHLGWGWGSQSSRLQFSTFPIASFEKKAASHAIIAAMISHDRHFSHFHKKNWKETKPSISQCWRYYFCCTVIV